MQHKVTVIAKRSPGEKLYKLFEKLNGWLQTCVIKNSKNAYISVLW